MSTAKAKYPVCMILFTTPPLLLLLGRVAVAIAVAVAVAVAVDVAAAAALSSATEAPTIVSLSTPLLSIRGAIHF
ncbi:MAG: hypothetical protein ACI8RD_011707 [Bacillariaceae sp.]|jgi:hypothetical protein